MSIFLQKTPITILASALYLFVFPYVFPSEHLRCPEVENMDQAPGLLGEPPTPEEFSWHVYGNTTASLITPVAELLEEPHD